MTTADVIADAEHRALPGLAEKINEATAAAESTARAAVEHALHAGRLLTEAKALVPHGQWEPWLLEHCTVAPRTAQAYMRLAKTLPTLSDEKRNAVADLPLREAVAAISTRPSARTSSPRHRVGTTLATTARPRLQSAWKSLRTLQSDIGCRPIKVERIKALRDKLQAALDALDQIERAV